MSTSPIVMFDYQMWNHRWGKEQVYVALIFSFKKDKEHITDLFPSLYVVWWIGKKALQFYSVIFILHYRPIKTHSLGYSHLGINGGPEHFFYHPTAGKLSKQGYFLFRIFLVWTKYRNLQSKLPYSKADQKKSIIGCFS